MKNVRFLAGDGCTRKNILILRTLDDEEKECLYGSFA